MEQNKSLKNISFERRYDPCKDGTDVVNQLYIPCLSNSIRYDRIAAYFNSSILQYYAAGLAEFAKNGGHARYIFSCESEDDDLMEITSAYNAKQDMEKLAGEITDDLEDDYNIANWSYLIKHNIVDVKIAFMLQGTGLVHLKLGIFEDAYGNKVNFNGSGNETPSAWFKNSEHFKVHTNYEGPCYDPQDIKDDEKDFEDMWNNKYAPGKIYATEPTGMLFERLCSFDKGRVFISQDEYQVFLFDKKVFVDIDEAKSEMLIFDYTEKHYFARYGSFDSRFGRRLSKTGENTYVVHDFTLSDLRDTVREVVNSYGEELCYSKKADAYCEKYNLNINKRISVGKSIKQRKFVDSLSHKYGQYKNIVDSETLIPLKEGQLLNGFHHYMMESSMDFSVPGSGKTYISYGLFAYLISPQVDKIDSLVVIGPLACFKAWKDENVALFGDKYNNTIFDSSLFSNKSIMQHLKLNKYRIYLLNYEIFNDEHLSKDIINETVNDRTLVIFDEIHRIKNPDPKTVRPGHIISAFHSLNSKPIYKLALSGTPIPNSFADLTNYIALLYEDDMNGYFRDFNSQYLKRADNDESIAMKITDELYPFYTRTTKNDLDIPPANPDDIVTLKTPTSKDEDDLFDLVYKAYSADNSLVRFLRLIQASSNPQLLLKSLDPSEINLFSDDYFNQNYTYNLKMSRLYTKDITDLVNKIGVASKTKESINFVCNLVSKGQKVIVWCLFIDTINLFHNELSKRGVKSLKITGSDTQDERNTKLESFKNGHYDVIITNPNTLAESVSLHTVCHNAVYVEYGFNLTYMLQSKDRIHRVGLPQGTETNYYFAISNSESVAGTVDTRIYDRLRYKETRMLHAIESNDIVYVQNQSDIDDINFIIDEIDKPS